ncbi:phage/plasmid primase, P4 family [Arthrobacter sp. N1]|uniref:phage/plasmid primase, P4 family n=1 Tax=Arthrobacter sp. N1 TaxID=619291 RepID=UPI003BAEFF1D
MTTTLETALNLHAQGISVVPVNTDGTKRPLGQWKHYQTSRATTEEIHRWFTTGDLGVGIVTGTISGHLEMLEVEGRAAHRVIELKDLAHASGLANLWDRVTAGWFELSPSGGYHWLYRLAWTPDHGKFPGNTKLAQAATRETTAETRGEAGFVVLAPSAGTVHPTGKPWTLLAGGPATVPTITPAEREQLHLIFGTLNEYEPHQVEQPSILDQALTGAAPLSSDGIKPGDDYEAKTDWADILTPAGWTLVYGAGRTRYWRRPGKTDPGFSATTGRAEDRDRLYVFTTSTEFQHEIPYTKFGAYALLHHGGDHTAAARALKDSGFGERPQHLRPADDVVMDLEQLGNPTRPAPAAPTPAPAVASVTDGTLALGTVHHLPRAYSETDDGNALRLVDAHHRNIRYVPQRGQWLTWDGHRWRWDEAQAVRELARQIARNLPADDKHEQKHQQVSLSRRGIDSMVSLAQSDQRTVAHLAALDARPYELNTPGGVVNLRTGEIAPPNPEALHTRSTAVAPDPTMPTPLFHQFLADTFAGDPDLTTYVQKLLGISLVGTVLEQIFPFAHGSGANGKTTLLGLLQRIIGIGDDGYSISAPAEMLLATHHPGHPTELARLAGARVVVTSELEDGKNFAEAKIKQLTGSDVISGRFMRQDWFSFVPTHTLWLLANHQPGVKAGGPAFWRRIRLLPFIHTVPPEKRIADLENRMAAEEGPGILAWFIQGAASYFEQGLTEPESVKAATADYANEQDSVGRFVEECCELGPSNDQLMHIRVSELRHEYETWCRRESEEPVSPKAFTSALTSRFRVSAQRSNTARFYSGIRFLNLSPDPDDPSPAEQLDLIDGRRYPS